VTNGLIEYWLNDMRKHNTENIGEDTVLW